MNTNTEDRQYKLACIAECEADLRTAIAAHGRIARVGRHEKDLANELDASSIVGRVLSGYDHLTSYVGDVSAVVVSAATQIPARALDEYTEIEEAMINLAAALDIDG